MSEIGALMKEAEGWDRLRCGSVKCLSRCKNLWVQSPASYKPDVAVHACNPSMVEAGTGGSEVRVHLT